MSVDLADEAACGEPHEGAEQGALLAPDAGVDAARGTGSADGIAGGSGEAGAVQRGIGAAVEGSLRLLLSSFCTPYPRRGCTCCCGRCRGRAGLVPEGAAALSSHLACSLVSLMCAS